MASVDLYVTVGADDGKLEPGWEFDPSGSLVFGNAWGILHGWLRFTGASGLAGTTITAAYLSNGANGVPTKEGTPNVRIYAERANSPAAPTTESDYLGRTLTTAYVGWGGVQAANPTPDITTVMQELVNNFNPTTILIQIRDNGSPSGLNYYGWTSYNAGAVPVLHIEYQDFGVTVTPAAVTVRAVVVAPTVILGSITLTPAIVTVRAVTINPTVILGSITLTPAAVTVRAVTINPAVIVGSAITPAAVTVRAVTINPTVILGSITLTPAVVTVRAVTINPTVYVDALPVPPLGQDDTPGLIIYLLAHAVYAELTAAGLGAGLQEPDESSAAWWGSYLFG